MNVIEQITEFQQEEHTTNIIFEKNILVKLVSINEVSQKDRNILNNILKKDDIKNLEINYKTGEKSKNIGRLYDIYNIQFLSRKVKNTIFKDKYIDIDMVNSSPILLYNICKNNHIKTPYLEQYIKKRDKILKTLDDNRENAKDIIISILHNSKNHNGNNFSINLISEMEHIITVFEGIFRSFYDKNKKTFKSDNIKGSFMSKLLSNLEAMILNEIIDYMKKKDIVIGLLEFDGLKVLKNDKITETLIKELEDNIKKKFNIKIQLKNKDMTDKYFNLDDVKINIENICERAITDKMYASYFVNKYGKDNFKIKVSNQKLSDTKSRNVPYIFINGMWSCNECDIMSIMSLIHPALENLKKQKDIIGVLPQVLEDRYDYTFNEKLQKSTAGYLLFEDGYYDFNNSKFIKEYNKEIIFTYKVPYKFPKKDENMMQEVKEKIFYSIFENKQIAENLIESLACAITGQVVKFKSFYFLQGEMNSGKGLITDLIENTFGNYVSTFNGENLCVKKSNGDEAKNYRWALLKRYCRILFSNEVKMEGFDSNIIKKFSSGGDRIEARTHGKEEDNIVPNFTCFINCNDIPKIKGYEDACKNRIKVFQMSYSFQENPEPNSNYQKKINPYLKEYYIEKQEVKDAVVWLMIDAYDRLKNNNMMINYHPEIFKNREEWFGNEDIKLFLEKILIREEEHNEKSKDIYNKVKHLGISETKFGLEMKKLQYTKKYIKKNNKSLLYYVNVKLLDEDDSEDE